jgi:hypothetical protein
MAEIRVERKKTNIWPWIIGLILLALVVWGIVEAMDNDRDDGVVETSAIEWSTETVLADATLHELGPQAVLARAA